MKQQPRFELEDVNRSAGRKVKLSSKAHSTLEVGSRLVRTEEENDTSQDFVQPYPVNDGKANLRAHHVKTIKHSDDYHGDNDVDFPQSPLKLIEFITDYSHLLPAQVVVQEGISSRNSDTDIAIDEEFLLHFIKRTHVIILNTENEIYSVPVSSSIRFGLIYNPIEVDENVSSYMQLPTIGDVMKLKQLPILVTATASHNCGVPEKSVVVNEILFIKGVVVNKSGGAKGKLLHVVNASNVEKFLSPKCAGNFSTEPHHMKLHLTTLLSHDIELPQYVIVYPEHDLRAILPHNLSNCPVLLASKKEEMSIVATRGGMKTAESGMERV